ncbi:MAG TPA: diacylglycerol kinase family lipid kinase [Gemmatales bacterium]|nr:diacylglycerol kinase family lipid kinase [Gemmatales bacterium]
MADPRVCVIYNPSAARSCAGMTFRRVRRLLGPAAEFQKTQGPGDAVKLARDAAQAGFATVAAAGGDGTVHEVANGLLQVGRPEVAFGVLPMGSGNDYARVLGVPFTPQAMCERLLASDSWLVDVGEVTADGGLGQRFFVNTMGFVLSGAATWEARRIRSLRGLPLYGLAAVRAIWKHFQAAPTQLQIDSRTLDWATLYLAVAVGRAEGGGFVVAPHAKLDDGWFDYLHAGPLSRWRALGYLPKMITGNLPDHDPTIHRGRCQTLAVHSQTPIFAHCDGEMFASPSAPASQFEIRMHPLRLKIRGPSA